jgi:hypothetical protein
MGRFHLGNSRLAGTEALGNLRLRQSESLATASEAFRQSQLHVDEAALLRGQLEKVTGITNRPSRPFEPSSFISAHRDLSSCR